MWDRQMKAIQRVDVGAIDHRVYRIQHPTCGWIEIVVIRPGSKAQAALKTLRKSSYHVQL